MKKIILLPKSITVTKTVHYCTESVRDLSGGYVVGEGGGSRFRGFSSGETWNVIFFIFNDEECNDFQESTSVLFCLSYKCFLHRKLTLLLMMST